MGFFSWIFGKNSTCPQCGAKVKAEYNFCPECKANSAGAWVLCQNCNAPIKGEMKFCPFCRTPQDPARVVRETAAIVWRRRPGQFAVRYEADPDFIKSMTGQVGSRSGVIVEFGTRALLFVDGRLAQTLDAGRYVEFTGLGKVFAQGTTVQTSVAVALISAGDTDFKQIHTGLRTKDNLESSLEVQYVIRLRDAAAFYENVMKGQAEVNEATLQGMLGPETGNALRESVRRLEAEQFVNPDLKQKQEMETSLLNHMNKTFGRTGLEFVQLRVVSPKQEEVEGILKERGEREIAQKRLEILNRAQQQELQQMINTATNEKDAQKALTKIGLARLLSKEESAELAQAWADGRGDVALARQQFMEKMKIFYEVELKKTRLMEEGKLSLQQISLQSSQLKGTLENERLARVERARIDADVQREDLKLTKDKADVGLDIRKRRQDMDMAQKQKEMEIERGRVDALKNMSREQLEVYLASQKPEMIEFLKAQAESKAQAERNKDLKTIYENMVNMIKDVTIAASTGKVATANDAANFVKIGAMAGQRQSIACVKCGTKLEPNFVVCPQCGADQPRL